MSRRPDPSAIKKAKGNPGRRPLNDAEPETTGVPLKPSHLSPKAALAWDYVLPLLQGKGLAGDLDAWALERMCGTYAEILEAEADLDAHGGPTYSCSTENGTRHFQHPAVAIRADADRRFKGYLIEFGMTPAGRSKVKISEGKATDPRLRLFGPRAAG